MNKYKKIALRLWNLKEKDQVWLLNSLPDDDSEKIQSLLVELKKLNKVPSKKLADEIYHRFISYSKQEVDFLERLKAEEFDKEFTIFAKDVFNANENYTVSQKVRKQVVNMASDLGT